MSNPPLPNPEEQEQRERLKALSDLLGLQNMQMDIDSCKENIAYLRKGMDEIINSWNEFNSKVSQPAQQPASQGTATQAPANQPQGSVLSLVDRNERVAILKDLSGVAKDLMETWRNFRNPSQPGNELLDANWFKDEATSIIKESLDVTHDINRSVKRALTGNTAKKAIVDVITHEPV